MKQLCGLHVTLYFTRFVTLLAECRLLPLYLREGDLIWQPSLLVQVLFIMFAVLTVQPHVVDNAQGHKHSSPAVVLSCPIWLVLGVRGHHPLVEGENSLDVPLTDTAARREHCLGLGQPT